MTGTLRTAPSSILGPRTTELMLALEARHGRKVDELLAAREQRRRELTTGPVQRLPATERVRTRPWKAGALPPALQERRVELIGGATRADLVQGMNAGAKGYVADLWNFSAGEGWSLLRAHRNLTRAARRDLAYLTEGGGRVRINPRSSTRLLMVPRPLHTREAAFLLPNGPPCGTLFDLAVHAGESGNDQLERQGGIHLVLRDVHGHLEARFYATLFEDIEEQLHLPHGAIRATVMIDSLAAALEAEEILFELVHHAAGLSFDPQGFIADHIALFHRPDGPVLPGREAIRLNAPLLRSLALDLVGICHRRGCLAIGAPSFVLPPPEGERPTDLYLEMLADKEREAVDGFDGTLVVHPGTVNAAMVEFNKSMPMANQLHFQRSDAIAAEALAVPPEGAITVDGVVSVLRTLLRAMVGRPAGTSHVVQGGRLHDRSSLRLAMRLLWHWIAHPKAAISTTGLPIDRALIAFMLRKEAGKLFGHEPEHVRQRAEKACERLLELACGEHPPMDPLDD